MASEGRKIVATMINLRQEGAVDVGADWPSVLARLASANEVSNEACEGLGHLVRKRHHAS
jgi:hypothetical protein